MIRVLRSLNSKSAYLVVPWAALLVIFSALQVSNAQQQEDRGVVDNFIDGRQGGLDACDGHQERGWRDCK
jgi:hypothetical protein